MEIPPLVRQELGDEEIRAGVNLGDEDALCLTETRTIIYSGEGLISDESVSVFPHDCERLSVSEGRRKTKFILEYVDGTRNFTVPSDRGDKVLTLLLEGILQVAGVIDPDEAVRGVYRFSELTLIVAQGRLVKHIGSPVWDEDFEEFPYDAVTELTFEDGSVATQIVITVDGRPQRIKAPNDQAPMVRETLTETLFEYHDVSSVEELNAKLSEPDASAGESDSSEASSDPADLTLDEGIDPLVGGSDVDQDDSTGSEPLDSTPSQEPAGGDDPASAEAQSSAETADAGAATDDSTPQEHTESENANDFESASPWPGEGEAEKGSAAASAGSDTSARAAGDDTETVEVPADDLEDVADQLSQLTTAVKRQNKLLKQQQDAFQQVVEELRKER